MNSQKTAISRKNPSTPLRQLILKDLIKGHVLDFGGGRGTDYLFLCFLETRLDITASYWDPNFRHQVYSDGDTFTEQKNACPYEPGSFDTITCTYVMNVLPPAERKTLVSQIKSLLAPGGKAYLTVRGKQDKIRGKSHEDGVITTKKTFQKTFSVTEIIAEIPGSELVLDQGRFITVSFQ